MSHKLFSSARGRYACLSLLTTFTSLFVGTILLAVLLSQGGYYFHGGVSVALTIVMVLTTVTAFLLSLVYRREAPLTNAFFKSDLTGTCFHVLFALFMLAFGGYHLFCGITLLSSNFAGGLSLIFSAVFAALGLRFPMHCVKKKPLPTVLSGSCIALSCILYALHLYFDALSPKNASMKLLLILAFLFLALFALSEVRRVLGKSVNLLYRFVIVAAEQLCALLSVAPLIMLDQEPRLTIGNMLTYLFLTLFFLYIFACTVGTYFRSDEMQEMPQDDSEEVPSDIPSDNSFTDTTTGDDTQ